MHPFCAGIAERPLRAKSGLQAVALQEQQDPGLRSLC